MVKVNFAELSNEPKEEVKEVKKESNLFTNEPADTTPAKKVIPKKNNAKTREVDEDIILSIVWGTDGTSKSEQILKFRDHNGIPPLVIDTEGKLNKGKSQSLARKLNFPVDNIIDVRVYKEGHVIDHSKTLENIRQICKQLALNVEQGKFYIDWNDKRIKFSAIGIDGISEIRSPYAKEEWKKKKNRKNPVTGGDWSEINQIVRDIIEPILNLGKDELIHVFFTCREGGEYVNNTLTRIVPDIKEWVWHDVVHKFHMIKGEDQNKFLAYCEKSSYDPFFTIDLTDWTHQEPSIFNILQDPELLTEKIEAFNDKKSNLFGSEDK